MNLREDNSFCNIFEVGTTKNYIFKFFENSWVRWEIAKNVPEWFEKYVFVRKH